MKDDDRRGFYKRVVIALDATTARSQAVEIAVRFAAAGRSELVGIFVEDINLINLSALPFSYEVTARSTRRHALEPADVERHLRRTAEEARRRLAALAARMNVPWRFVVVRGELAGELLAAAQATDLLVLHDERDVAAPPTSRVGVGIVACKPAVAGSLFVGRRAKPGRVGIVALVRAEACSRWLVESIAALAVAHEQPLLLFAAGAGTAALVDLADRFQKAVAGAQPVTLRPVPDFEAPGLAEAINMARPSLVVMGADEDEAATKRRLRRLAEGLDAPLLLLRAGD